METSLKDLCSSRDTHAAHALFDRLTKLRCGIFSCVRKFLPFSQKGSKQEDSEGSAESKGRLDSYSTRGV